MLQISFMWQKWWNSRIELFSHAWNCKWNMPPANFKKNSTIKIRRSQCEKRQFWTFRQIRTIIIHLKLSKYLKVWKYFEFRNKKIKSRNPRSISSNKIKKRISKLNQPSIEIDMHVKKQSRKFLANSSSYKHIRFFKIEFFWF